MFGPGAYRPNPTEGITAIADLPPPEIVPYRRTYERQACPRCAYQAYRDKQPQRTLHDFGNLDIGCPRDLVVTYAQHEGVSHVLDLSEGSSKLIPIHEEPNHQIVHLFRLGKADRPTH